MQSLTHQCCFNHAQREAAARCVECRHFFCRECVTEHDDRIVCAACLLKQAKRPITQNVAFVRGRQAAQCLLSLLLLWFCFYLAGQALLSIPVAVHEGTLWHATWIDKK